jgi:predicted Zn-dependent protease
LIAFKYFTAEKVVNPETGKEARVALSKEEESVLGLQSYKEVLSKSKVVEEGAEVDQVRRVARRLAAATGEGGKGFKWEVSVVDSKEVNAFCLPGGKIVVYTGILPVTKTDAGLAAVMGHEMAHATAHHGAQRLFQDDIYQTAMNGAQQSIADLDPEKQRAVMAALGAGAKFGVILPFSRDHETEADEMGILYMARAGYDPRESVKFWERMEKMSGGQPPEFSSTHPSHGTRIARLKKFMPKAMEAYEKSDKQASNDSN